MNKAQRQAASQSNAQMIFNVLKAERSPRDAAATLSAVHAALIWEVEQADEELARKMMTEMVEGVVELWKANRKFYEEQKAKSIQ